MLERSIDLGTQPLDLDGCVAHPMDECCNLVAADTGEVVADRHVEDVRTGIGSDEWGQWFPVAQHLDQHRRLHVLGEALGDRQLLTPLDVVADGLHVDAGPIDDKVVDDLHRLQFEQTRPAEPGQHDVLGQLRVGPGCRTNRTRTATPEKVEPEVDLRVGLPETSRREIEDLLSGTPLVVDAAEQRCQRHRREGRGFLHGPDATVWFYKT